MQERSQTRFRAALPPPTSGNDGAKLRSATRAASTGTSCWGTCSRSSVSLREAAHEAPEIGDLAREDRRRLECADHERTETDCCVDPAQDKRRRIGEHE